MSLVTGAQQRAVKRIQRDLDLNAPIENRSSGLSATTATRWAIWRQRREFLPRRPNSNRDQGRKRNPSLAPAPNRVAPGAGTAATKFPQSVYIANLPWTATVEDVQALFGQYGKVHQTTIITDRKSGRSKGFGFVDMTGSAARAAIEALNGSSLEGRDLTVRFAKPRQYGG